MNQDRSHPLEAHRHLSFQVIPVIDLQNGQAVHAVGGRRAHYRPLQSILHPSPEPVALARALSHTLALETTYLADLDAISGRGPALEVYQKFIASGLHLWIDAGIRDRESLTPLLALEHASSSIVAGLETLDGPQSLADLVKRAGPSRVIFSLDLFDGKPQTSATSRWGPADPFELAKAAVDCGVGRLLILDLARVGTGRGPGASRLTERILADAPGLSLSIGGGISRIDEIAALRDLGVRAVLVGSAIHDGRIGARELRELESGIIPGTNG